MAEDKLQANLIEKIVKLDQIVKSGDSRQYAQARKLIKELVNGFNSHEL